MNIAAFLANSAVAFAHRPAVSVGNRVLWSYAQLHARVRQLAAGLRALPTVALGDRVALFMSNRPQYLEVLFAIWHAGLVAVPVNAKLHPRELQFILQNCGVKACFVTVELGAAVNDIANGVDALAHIIDVDAPEYDRLFAAEGMRQHAALRDDLAWIFYTSGTTGKPKGAMLSHLNLQVMTLSYLCDIDMLTERDALLHLGPQSHAAGLFSLSHLAKGSNQVLPESGGFDAAELVSLINHYPSSTFFLAPTMLRRFMEAPELTALRVENVRTILCGAAPVYVEDVKRALKAFGLRFWNGYGQGESPCTITAMPKHFYGEVEHPRYLERIGSVGIARSGVQVRVVDADGNDTNDIGEIIVRGDVVMRGYWNNTEATRAAIVDGWLHTGDLGVMDADGFLTLKDRSKDLIISGGANIYPREVEEVLLRHPQVAEVAVIGLPDQEWGERVVAYVVARDVSAVNEAALDQLCLDNIARFKRPKVYRFVPELPKNNYGKVLKTELRSRPL